MLLRIISNFPETENHYGTVDRDQPGHYYDFRGKAQGCYNAAKSLPGKLLVQDRDERTNIELRLDADVKVEYQNTNAANRELPAPQRAAFSKVHSEKHIEGIKTAALKLKPGECNQNFGKEADIWSGTYSAAISSLAACLTCVDFLAQDNSLRTRAFANVWPPGHHAEGAGKDGSADIAMGFCYFSNAAVAAMYARQLGLRTVVIDIDNHSGNGTRKSLMHEKDLAVVDFVYCSPFNEKRGGYLDGFFERKIQQVIGVAREFPYRQNDAARGIKAHPVYTASNILSLEFVGREYRQGVEQVEPAASPKQILDRYSKEALPWIKDFNPQMVIWSIGLDSVFDDPLGALGFAPGTYYEIIQQTSSLLPDAKVMGVMEGGYKAENWERCLWPALYGLAGV